MGTISITIKLVWRGEHVTFKNLSSKLECKTDTTNNNKNFGRILITGWVSRVLIVCEKLRIFLKNSFQDAFTGKPITTEAEFSSFVCERKTDNCQAKLGCPK